MYSDLFKANDFIVLHFYFVQGCQGAKSHEEECRILAKNNFKGTIEDVSERTLCLDFLGSWRLILELKKRPELKSQLLTIDTHNEERKCKYNTKYFINCEDSILKTLRNKCNVGSDFTDEEILTIMGLVDMYSASGPRETKIFHPSVCFMPWSCQPNTYMTLLSDMSIMIKASVKIRKGDLITRCPADDVLLSNYFRYSSCQANY